MTNQKLIGTNVARIQTWYTPAPSANQEENTMTKLGWVLALAVVVMMPTTMAYAEGEIPDIEGVIYEEPVGEKTRRVTLGLGAASVPDYEGSEDSEVLPAPMVRVDWQSRRYVELSGVQFRANLVSGAGKWRAGPTLKYNPGRNDVDNDRIDSLRDVDATIEGGAFVTFDAGRMETYLEVLTDVGDEHEGSLVTIRQTYKQPLENRQMLTVSLSLTYADDDYMETFFTIDANNAARSGLRTFEQHRAHPHGTATPARRRAGGRRVGQRRPHRRVRTAGALRRVNISARLPNSCAGMIPRSSPWCPIMVRSSKSTEVLNTEQ